MKKICVATGSRAEYGLLKPLLIEICKQKNWQLQLVVTGMHLSPEFGLTFNEIEKDGFKITKKIEILLSSDSPEGVVKSIGLGAIGFADALKELQPDLVIILGDRFEMLSIAEAALIFKIPVAHLHGGEITEGAYDDSIRHAITKMSHLHFASTEIYKNRIIQMGENPDCVFNVGAIGLDNIKLLTLLSKSDLQKRLNIVFKTHNYLITFHPATLNETTAALEFEQLIAALKKQENSLFIFTKSNADNGGRLINELIDKYVSLRPENSIAFTSLGQQLYLSVMQYMDAVVGNSSSGIIEAASFKVPAINIGDRQKGRIHTNNVVNCKSEQKEIEKAFESVKLPAFKRTLQKIINPYGSGNTASSITKVLKNTELKKLIPKKFYDIKINTE
ncbi:MAG TPA: UDP-N-acetylglucosamine 2-epimerase [Chitinophagaceae bacterium]|jgi:GDP/UDP-N,N'-diacetylbacillosamine 2-epimerase (hydrolysing)